MATQRGRFFSSADNALDQASTIDIATLQKPTVNACAPASADFTCGGLISSQVHGGITALEGYLKETTQTMLNSRAQACIENTNDGLVGKTIQVGDTTCSFGSRGPSENGLEVSAKITVTLSPLSTGYIYKDSTVSSSGSQSTNIRGTVTGTANYVSSSPERMENIFLSHKATLDKADVVTPFIYNLNLSQNMASRLGDNEDVKLNRGSTWTKRVVGVLNGEAGFSIRSVPGDPNGPASENSPAYTTQLTSLKFCPDGCSVTSTEIQHLEGQGRGTLKGSLVRASNTWRTCRAKGWQTLRPVKYPGIRQLLLLTNLPRAGVTAFNGAHKPGRLMVVETKMSMVQYLLKRTSITQP